MGKYLLLLTFCCSTIWLSAQKNVLETIIRDNRKSFGAWADAPDAYDIQVIYTQIDRDAAGRPHFTSYRYGVDPNTYFYPASTVKMPAAFMALEKINDLGIRGLDKHTPMQHDAATPPQTAAWTDATSPNGLPSVGHYARKIFLVSDNDAYNRLYEFLGQGWFNSTLRQKGFTETRIIHRLSVPGFDTLGNRLTNPVRFFNEQGVLYAQAEGYSQFYDDLGLSQQHRGLGYMDSNDQLVNEPFDFSYKNFVSVQDLHDMLKAVIFPDAVAEEQRFHLTPDDYTWLYRAMGQRPRESKAPDYSGADAHPDNYVKFWLYGDRDSSYQIPANIRILNKVGWAYGFLTDVAYIVDLDTGVEFMLTGTIHVNANKIYNDGVYEYEEVGLPFFGELGRAVMAYEEKRTRRHRADTGWLRRIFE